MLGALSLADRGLAETLLHETFQHVHPPSQPNSRATHWQIDDGGEGKEYYNSRDKAAISGADVGVRVMNTIEACREMLAREPPERLTEYWGTVSHEPPKTLLP
jgi:cyclin H